MMLESIYVDLALLITIMCGIVMVRNIIWEAKIFVGEKHQIRQHREQIYLDVKIGDKILFGKYSGTEVKVDGEDLVVMREEDVMAVIESK